MDIVSAAANGTPGLGRYPPFKREIGALASAAALDGFQNVAKNMVVAIVAKNMVERTFFSAQQFIRLVQRRMGRQQQQDEVKTRSFKKGPEADPSGNRASSPQTGGTQAGGCLKSVKDKPVKEKDAQESSSDWKIGGLEGEITAANSADLIKAESLADKAEWVYKLGKIMPSSKGPPKNESDLPMRRSVSDGSLDTRTRRPADPEENLRWMSQEVCGYVEAVLNSLAANEPKAWVLFQVEKAKEDNKLYSSISGQSSQRIGNFLQEDQNVKLRRGLCKKQSAILLKLTRQLRVHDNRAAAASGMRGIGGSESSPRTSVRVMIGDAANGPSDFSRSGFYGHSSRRYSDPYQNNDASLTSRSSTTWFWLFI